VSTFELIKNIKNSVESKDGQTHGLVIS